MDMSPHPYGKGDVTFTIRHIALFSISRYMCNNMHITNLKEDSFFLSFK